MEFPSFENIRKVTVGDVKDGMTYLVGGFQRKGKVKVVAIEAFHTLMYHTSDEVIMLSIIVKDVETGAVYKWFDLSLREISKIEYFDKLQ